MEKFNFNDLIKETVSADKISINKPNTHRGGHSKYSLGITYNVNGKRCTLSKSLAEKLDLNGSVCFGLITAKRIVVIGKDIETLKDYKYSSTSGKPIIYNVQLVENIVFGMNIENIFEGGRTSITFSEFEFDEDEKVAFVKIPSSDEIKATL